MRILWKSHNCCSPLITVDVCWGIDLCNKTFIFISNYCIFIYCYCSSVVAQCLLLLFGARCTDQWIELTLMQRSMDGTELCAEWTLCCCSGCHLQLPAGQGRRTHIWRRSSHLRHQEERWWLVGGRYGRSHWTVSWQLRWTVYINITVNHEKHFYFWNCTWITVEQCFRVQIYIWIICVL